MSRSLGIWAGSAHRLLGGVGVGVSSPLGICAGSAHRLLSDLGEETCVLLGDSGVVAGGFVGAVVAALARSRARVLPRTHCDVPLYELVNYEERMFLS